MSKITSVSHAGYFLKHSGAILKFEFGGDECLLLAHWLSLWRPVTLFWLSSNPGLVSTLC
jgi:hypothetical protein